MSSVEGTKDGPPVALPDLDADFAIGERLGAGAGGSVHKALQLSLGRSVAIKRLHGLKRGPTERRFLAEAAIMGRVAHPNIVQVLMHGRIGGQPVLVMEHIQGLDLAALMGRLSESEKPYTVAGLREALGADSLPWPDNTPWWKVSATVVAQVARALDHAHHCGILHRDVKPGNVLVAKTGDARLTDFGVAKWIEAENAPSEPATESGAMTTTGTLAYSSPEELQGQPPTPASDLYSLGILAMELVTGRPAYVDTDGGPAAQIRSIVEGRLSPLGRDIPADLRAILGVATATIPSQRYGTAGDFARDLENAVAGRPVFARPEGAGRRARRWIARRSQSAAAVATLAILTFSVPTAIQYTRLRAAKSMAMAASAAREHLRLAVDGIGQVLVDVAAESLIDQPLLNANRSQLLRVGSTFTRDLAKTIPSDSAARGRHGEDVEFQRRLHAMREDALEGLIHMQRRMGELVDARKSLAELDRCETLGVALGDPRRTAVLQYIEVTLAQASNDAQAMERLAAAALESLDSASIPEGTAETLRSSLWATRVEAALILGETARAVKYGEIASERAERWLERASNKELARREISRIFGNYSAALITSGQLDRARECTGYALVMHSSIKASARTHELEAIHWNNLAAIEYDLGRYGLAEEAGHHALAIQEPLLAAFPRSVSLRFFTAHSRLRLSLAKIQQGNIAGEAHDLLKAAVAGLQTLCRAPNPTWAQLQDCTIAACTLGRLELRARHKRAAFEAFDTGARSANAAMARYPQRSSLRSYRVESWFKRTGLALDLKIGDPREQLRLYDTEFPDNALVDRNVATMFCVLAKQLSASWSGTREELASRVTEYHDLALDHLESADHLHGLPRDILEGHAAWQPLRDHPRFRALLK